VIVISFSNSTAIPADNKLETHWISARDGDSSSDSDSDSEWDNDHDHDRNHRIFDERRSRRIEREE